ncbi:MAG: MarR family transcriptional regulator [Flavobacteriales bacterium]|nr:MarR family transcriptional regulator [Flavobacteriales bacterium]
MLKHPDIMEQMVVAIMQTGFELDQNINAILRSFEITTHQYNILRILRGASPGTLSQKQIRERMIFRNPDLTRLLDRLITKKLVERNVCPGNRRQSEISITDTGLDMLDRIYPVLKKDLHQFFKNLIPVEEAGKMVLHLQTVTAMIKEVDGGD